MTSGIKILIAYDGSDCAEAALDDLPRAGQPQEAEALVVSVAERWMPPPSGYEVMSVNFAEHFPDFLSGAKTAALNAQHRLNKLFPNWKVRTEVLVGAPARVILDQAIEWGADLIVVGSHGRSALGRFFLGSVSNKLINESSCSVRIARGRVEETPGEAARIIIGTDGSPGAAAAVNAVAARHWPAGSEVHLVNADIPLPTVAAEHSLSPIVKWITDERARIHKSIEEASVTLRAAGLSVTSVVEEGDPKTIICNEAEKWGADCIFIGAKSHTALDRILIGSVSSAVASRAHCSVEIIRVK